MNTDLEYIKAYLARPGYLLTGFDLKAFSRMGDRVAVFILKVLDGSWDVDNTKLRLILTAVRAALEYPESIEDESDRRPAVSLCLLELLMARPRPAEELELIRSTTERVRGSSTNDTKREQ